MHFIEDENKHLKLEPRKPANPTRKPGDVALSIDTADLEGPTSVPAVSHREGVADAFQNYNPRQDEVPHHFCGVDGPRFNHFNCFLGFHESPFEVTNEESMVMAVGMRSIAEFSPR